MTTLEKLEELVHVSFKERDAQIQALTTRVQGLERQAEEARIVPAPLPRKFEQTWDDLASRWEVFFEDYLKPAAYQIFAERGILLHTQAESMTSERQGERCGVGPFMAGDEYAVLLYVGCEPDMDSIHILREELENFIRFFPRYEHHKVIGAAAGITFTEEVKMYAFQQGLFVIAQSGETVKILNDAKFTPKVWNAD